MQAWDIERDRSRTEVFEVDGRKFIITATDPYGFCTIRSEVGRTPDKLGGHFTTHHEAKKAIAGYVNEMAKASPTKTKEVNTPKAAEPTL